MIRCRDIASNSTHNSTEVVVVGIVLVLVVLLILEVIVMVLIPRTGHTQKLPLMRPPDKKVTRSDANLTSAVTSTPA